MKKIVFLTGTRADYGKIKTLMNQIDRDPNFELYLFVTGMHMLSRYGSTWREIEKDGFNKVYHYINQNQNTPMDLALSNTITGLSHYVHEIKPDMIVVHGDRLEALAGAIVGAFNNIRVAHIEGGEVSGTIDESIRHAITKFAHLHFVSNEESKKRIVQLGENSEHIFIIGSPDIDIMYSNNLPSLQQVKDRYNILFDDYSIVLYHPVTTEYEYFRNKVKAFVDALIASRKNYVVIYPNNDLGSDIIIDEYNSLSSNPRFAVYPSIRFEYFLTLMKHANFMIGNSSAGIREAAVYGIPTIDVGNRQSGRYLLEKCGSIRHADENVEDILDTITNIPLGDSITDSQSSFGNGDSSSLFMNVIRMPHVWDIQIQKKFSDL